MLQGKNKARKFTPEIIIDKLTKEIRSVLEFPLIAEDHGAIYKCRSFAEATMSVPQDSALTIAFNITCKLIYFMSKNHFQFFFFITTKNYISNNKLFSFIQIIPVVIKIFQYD